MFLILSYLIYFVISTVSYSGTILTIIDETIIGTDQVSKYKDATSLSINSTSEVTIKNQAFEGFSALKTISIQANKISISAASFTDCSAIQTVCINSQFLNIQNDAFQPTVSFKLYYSGTSFTSSKDIFVLPNDTIVDEINIDVTGDCIFSFLEKDLLAKNTKNIIIKATNINVGQQSFQNATSIDLLKLDATESIKFGLDSFLQAEIKEIQCHAGKNISILQQSFQKASKIKLLNLTCDNSISIGICSFINAKIDEIIITATDTIKVTQQSFSQNSQFKILNMTSRG